MDKSCNDCIYAMWENLPLSFAEAKLFKGCGIKKTLKETRENCPMWVRKHEQVNNVK